MKKKKESLPRQILKGFANEIRLLEIGNQGRLHLLERLEDMPYEFRTSMLEGMSSFYEPRMVEFFYLIKMEYGEEFAAICDKALEKYRMSGMDVREPEFFAGTFYKAFASRSRHTGRISMDVAWNDEKGSLMIESFYLTYNPDGIYGFVLIEDVPHDAYENERDAGTDMAEIDFSEACALIYQAYAHNLRYNTMPALGKYLYQKYIEYFISNDSSDQVNLIQRLCPRFTPRQLVNCYLQGVRNRDYIFLNALIDRAENFAGILDQLQAFTGPGIQLLEAQAYEVHALQDRVAVSAYAITAREEEVLHNRLKFYLVKDLDNLWHLDDMELLEQEYMNRDGETEPFFAGQVICRIYSIIDLDELFEILEKMDNIHEMEELTYGVHMRVLEEGEDHRQGVKNFQGVVANIVINGGEELAIISKNPEFIEEMHQLLSHEYSSAVISTGRYEVDMLTAYKYIGGKFRNFEDILYHNAAAAEVFDDGIRFLSTTYTVLDHPRVNGFLHELQDKVVEIGPDRQVFYQFKYQTAGPGYFVEYLLSPDWLSISALGESDLETARNEFEQVAAEYLEFEQDIERRGSIFDVLTTGIKKEYPELEAALKEIYLNKWYYSGLRQLQGMSPSEASQTEEGTRLLWKMFKKSRGMKKNNNRRRLSVNEYLRKLEQKKPEKQ